MKHHTKKLDDLKRDIQDHIDVIITYGVTCLTKKQQKLSNLRY